MRVVFTGGGTGGHLYPALAVARALCAAHPEVEAFFIGAARGLERHVLPQTEFPHLLLDLHPLYRMRPWKNWRTVAGLVGAWRDIGGAMAPMPACVLGTGGYASGAMLAWGIRRGIPIALQEQNSFAGRTTRFFSRWAQEVYLGFPEAADSLPARARRVAVDTGNPIQAPPASRPSHAEARRRWGLHGDARVLLVFGGSQGSAALNHLVEAWVARGLPPGLDLIWATGVAHYPRYAALASERVIVREYLAPIGEAYAAADLALTRAGAMTTAELCAWGIPSLLIPLPTAAADHQTANARSLASAGAAHWIPEREATAERLDAMVRGLLADPAELHRLGAGALARARPGAAAEIASRIARIIELRRP